MNQTKTKQLKNKYLQLSLEKQFNDNQISKVVHDLIAQDDDVQEFLNSKEYNSVPKKVWEKMIAEFLIKKRIRPDALIGLLWHAYEQELSNQLIDQVISDILYAEEIGLITWDDRPNQRNYYLSCLDIPEDIQAQIDQWQFPLPVVCEPEKLTKNTDTIYLNIGKQFVVRHMKPDNNDYVLDSLNKMNSVALAVNEVVMNNCHDKWKKMDNEMTQRNFERFKKYAKIALETLLTNGNRFHFNYRPDHRGRAYADGYHTNTQGNDYAKACLQLADKEIVSADNMFWIKIDIATAYGKDKLTWNERVNWFDEHWAKQDFASLEADEPCRAYAGLNAYREALAGKPTGFMCGLDSTSSGPQMMSVILGSKKGAYYTNLFNPEKRVDMYTEIYSKFQEHVKSNKEITRQNLKDTFMQYFYGGSATPKAILGEENFDSLCECLEEEVPELNQFRNFMLEAANPRVKDYEWTMPDGFYVHNLVHKTEYIPFKFKGRDYNLGIKSNAPKKGDKSLGANTIHSIDAFILREMYARCMYDEEKINKVRILNNKVKNLKSMKLKIDQNDYKDLKLIERLLELGKASGYYSFRMLEHINEMNIKMLPEGLLDDMLSQLPAKPFSLVSVHDCFYSHPNYTNNVKDQYRKCLLQLNDSQILQFVLRQELRDDSIVLQKTMDLHDYIAKEEYAIC